MTREELTNRLDNEFQDCDFRITDCPTKGVVATVYFYEEELEEKESSLMDKYRDVGMSPSDFM